jgi:hypothetical protein
MSCQDHATISSSSHLKKTVLATIFTVNMAIDIESITRNSESLFKLFLAVWMCLVLALLDLFWVPVSYRHAVFNALAWSFLILFAWYLVMLARQAIALRRSAVLNVLGTVLLWPIGFILIYVRLRNAATSSRQRGFIL